ncbi:formate dehydrogenase accessory sulfurtransferase FdhD [Hydrogenophilus thermoluteolus]|uniref:Sulfur carrier protein FdhD n=1 Tax=Hydrogenophilus thermoluteolus TaxID=297 RepID=A0A2Z6E0H8_HYDTE|nr:formate dehydrogenase accessory sulfurtransferase FdhD [Hydrogenophilus thermoluteolus]MBW7656195.1 formate dehydrogenase accessory sulfurtransferase FdhD [Hydrogenophilus thermoluteolus]BBD78128.1 formate dehydrogenase family accessory protein FdhD [Hydrogenophilus thermoluteolus]GLW61449.1 sulfurtransferase FdhD [Hydrogenophilus thermoluteolus]
MQNPKPLLSNAQIPLTQTISAWDETGTQREIAIAAERPLTVYVNKREIVTLMTLGAAPEALVIGYLRNQRLVSSLSAIASVQVDWEVESAAVWLHELAALDSDRLMQRTVTTGCGQGTVFGSIMEAVEAASLPTTASIHHEAIGALLEAVRLRPTLYKTAGAIHGCALVAVNETAVAIRYYVEDVGRHNAVDTIAGWMWLDDISAAGHVFYTTGRLTSEMVLKAALMGIPIVVSRSGISAMGYNVAQRLGMTLIGRATGQHYLIYTHPERVVR